MQSTAKDVSTYLEEVPAERKAALVELRKQCLATLKGFEESMQYGGPCYSRNGVVEVGFASQKHFIGLYILRTDVMKSHLELLKIKGVSRGQGMYPLFQAREDRFQSGGEHVEGYSKVHWGGLLMKII